MIIPYETIGFNLESHIRRNSITGGIIYISMLVMFAATLVSLPFLNFDVGIRAGGIIRPVTEKAEIKTLLPGTVESVLVSEGQEISAGSPIICLTKDHLIAQMKNHVYRIRELNIFCRDLAMLLKDSCVSTVSGMYTSIYDEYTDKREYLKSKLNKSVREYKRYETLFMQDLVSEKEYDDLKHEMDLVNKELAKLKSTYAQKWQEEIDRYGQEIKMRRSQMAKLKNDIRLTTVKSPVSGTVEIFSGIYPGSRLIAGETIAQVSPSSSLVAETYVAPGDIGHISVGQHVKLRIDAFNYSGCEAIDAVVSSVGSDFMLINQEPAFRVRCEMEKDWVKLGTGNPGKLKKGMTFRARFIVANRSAAQLIFDRVNDWINPSR